MCSGGRHPTAFRPGALTEDIRLQSRAPARRRVEAFIPLLCHQRIGRMDDLQRVAMGPSA